MFFYILIIKKKMPIMCFYISFYDRLMFEIWHIVTKIFTIKIFILRKPTILSGI